MVPTHSRGPAMSGVAVGVGVAVGKGISVVGVGVGALSPCSRNIRGKYSPLVTSLGMSVWVAVGVDAGAKLMTSCGLYVPSRVLKPHQPESVPEASGPRSMIP